ncbi:hypothetical protein CEE85_12070, partial [Lactobacillus crispatus]
PALARQCVERVRPDQADRPGRRQVSQGRKIAAAWAAKNRAREQRKKWRAGRRRGWIRRKFGLI